jgi:cell wall-associated NlpC family hydrolase
MRRLVALLGAVLALALSSTASADTFRVVPPHASGGAGSVAFSPGATVIPFTRTAQAQNGSMSFAALRSIWQAAGNAYGIPWEVLAAINKVETNFGQNLGPSSAGAVGWMQFMPSTWARWGMDANGDGIADPNNPTDAIFSAARYLAGCGGQFDIARAVYCYNHASWYVTEVLGLATAFSRNGGNGVFSVDQLQTRIKTASSLAHTMHSRLSAALAKARTLAHAERRFLRQASSATLLSDQLEARKHAVRLGARRYAAEARASTLRKRLDAANSQLSRFRDEASGALYATNAPGLFSGTLPGGDQSGAVSIALQYLGVPYKWAGATPQGGFDCSGLVQYVYAQLGVSLPHNTVAQWNYPGAVPVPQDQLQPGDLVFFNGLDHVGIYIGNGDFIDAPHTGAFLRIDNLGERWYAAKYDGAKRILGASLGGTMTFATGGGSAFSSNVVYFTH